MESEEGWNFFEDVLPPEVAEIVFSFLSLEDIVYVSLVCKTWNTYFDTKDIWRKIIEHYYGELSEKNVDLTQQFRWKRIFIILHNAHAWAKTFQATTTTYTSPYVPADNAQMGSSGQYIHTLTSSIEIKMAGKIVQVKRDPLTIDAKQWIPVQNANLLDYVLASSNGKYLIRGDAMTYYLCDGDTLASTDVGGHSVTRLLTRNVSCPGLKEADPAFMAHYGSFNSRYVVLANNQRYHHIRDHICHLIFDLKSQCNSIRPMFKDKQKNAYCWVSRDLKCNDMFVKTPHGALGVYASQIVPDLIVFIIRQVDEARSTSANYAFNPKLVIWRHGKGLQEEKSHLFKNELDLPVTDFSDHLIDEYHWICFNMGQYTRIINLNNFNNQFKLDLIAKRMWIPKKNKIILVSGKKITVFDLQLNRWTSRMSCPNEVCAMTFNKSSRILLVADTQFVHAFHWETAKLIGSLQHPLANSTNLVRTLHIGYDQVIIINGKIFMKMPTKCDM